MAPKPTQIEAGPTLLEVKSPIPGNMEKALRRVMPQPMADFVFGAVVYELQAGDAPKKKPPERGHTYGGGENVTRAYASPMEDTYPDDEFGYDTIDLMLKTGTVRFALELKKAAVLSALFNELQWQIECEDEKLREIVTADMKRVFATYGAEMLSMLEYGAFFGELVWEYAPATMRGLESRDKWWVLEGINTVKPETVDHINRVREGKNMGRFDGFVQKANMPWPKHTVSVDQALILTFRKKWRNLWGESILKAAYPLWYWFDIILAAFIRYLGRSGIPLTVCTAPMKGRMKMSDGTWMSTMDYGLLVATEATRSEAVALPSDRNPETSEPLFTLDYLTDDKRGDQFIGALKFVSDLLTRAIIMGAMADMSKEGGGFNREEARFGMTQLDNQQILSMMISQLARYHLPKYATYNASPGTYIDMLLVGLDPSRIDRVFKFLSTAGNQKEGDALNWPDWELIFQLSGVPTLTKEEVDRLKKEREQKALEMQKMMKEKKAEEEGPPQEGKEKEGEEKKEELEEVLWEVLMNGSPILLSANQLEGIARNNPDLFQEQTTITLARGQGRGQGGPPQGEGGPEKCVCPKCGATVDHAPGKPCTERHCPRCGALMRGDLKEKLIDALRSGNVVLYNPYHDSMGRFTSKAAAVSNVALGGALASYVVAAGASLTGFGLGVAAKEYKKRGDKETWARAKRYSEKALKVAEVSAQVGLGLYFASIIGALFAPPGTPGTWNTTRGAREPTSWPEGVDEKRAHQAYRNFAKQFHPDVAKGMSKEQATAKFRDLKGAYDAKDWASFEKWAKETGVKLEEGSPGPVLDNLVIAYRILKDALADGIEWIYFDVDADIDWLPEADGMYVMHRSQAQYIVSLLEEIGKTPTQAFREMEEIDADFFLSNPYHDEKGRFASREHAVMGAGIRSEGKGKKKVRGRGKGPIGEPKSDLMPHEFKYSRKIVNRKKFEDEVNRQGGELAKRLPGCDDPSTIRVQDASFAYAGAHTDGTILLPLQTASRIAKEKSGFGHHVLLHERIHARTRTRQRYGSGSWEEEGTTELLARKMYKDIYGGNSPSNAYNRYVGQVGRAAWQASDGDAEKAWKYVDDAHNGKVEITMPTDGQGWEAMLGAKYKFEEAEDLMDQLLDLIEQKKWEEAKAFIDEHPEDSLILVFGEVWIQEFGI